MPHKLSLYLDEDVHPDVAPVLRGMGFDVVTTIEMGNKGASDNDQIEFAIQENRTLLTFNVRDFVLLYDFLYDEGRKHAGIVVSSQIGLKELLRRLLKLLNHTSAEEMANNIEFLNNWK
jgi:predicted nuclease of predicted toxin-antitoxin system